MPHNRVVESNNVFLVSFYTTGGSEKAVDTMTGLADYLSICTDMTFNYIRNRKQSN